MVRQNVRFVNCCLFLVTFFNLLLYTFPQYLLKKVALLKRHSLLKASLEISAAKIHITVYYIVKDVQNIVTMYKQKEYAYALHSQ